ncbi:MAG: protein phosphatase 2C domain-containing protein [Gloeobacterales cyanobacterium]
MYYLAVGDCSSLSSRYQVTGEATQPKIVEDTSPALAPDPNPQPMPPLCRPYQRLNAFRWAIPGVHSYFGPKEQPCLLLEEVPVTAHGFLWPSLKKAWAEATLLHQLGWLLQIARLWDPCIQEGVAQSLLRPENTRVQGWQIRLSSLEQDTSIPSLRDLGILWQQWTPAVISLQMLMQSLAEGKITKAKDLIGELESLAMQYGSTAKAKRIVGATDPGNRPNNEDTFAYNPEGRYGIVCDGMGGHEGGEVASHLAVQSLEEDSKTLTLQSLSALQIRQGLADALYRANQQIFKLNQQQGRDRYRKMGTTAVAYCLTGPLLHLAHVGDSRIYLIDQYHCQQVTVDDDVANLEISLARTTSSAIRSVASAGALTQALGVIANTSLQPTVQTFVLPEDCLVLLCSDGLCDGAFVEKHWQDALLPLLDQDLSDKTQGLIKLALRELGHDNITFILLQYSTGQPAAERRSATDLQD